MTFTDIDHIIKVIRKIEEYTTKSAINEDHIVVYLGVRVYQELKERARACFGNDGDGNETFLEHRIKILPDPRYIAVGIVNEIKEA